jgi:hypothetical protein
MPSPEETKAAGYHDVSDWGEKDQSGAYPPGTTFELDGGEKVDVTKVPDIIGRKPKRSSSRSSRRRRGA